MTHQPYLDWILADPSLPEARLTRSEQIELQKHLAGCAECSRLSLAWSAIEDELEAAPLSAPKPGFTARWQARLEADRLHQHQRQGLVIGSASLGLGLALFGVLVYLAWPLVSEPRLLVWTYVYQLLRWISLLSTIGQITGSVLRGISLSIPLALWVIMSGMMAVLLVIWVAVYRVLAGSQRISLWSKNK